MSKIVTLPRNFIGKGDRERIESFGGHTIAHGRATRWHWEEDKKGNDVFAIYRGGGREELIASISRDMGLDTFCARNAAGVLIVSGTLVHVFAVLEQYLARLHGETLPPSA